MNEFECAEFLMMVVQMGYLSYKILKHKQNKQNQIQPMEKKLVKKVERKKLKKIQKEAVRQRQKKRYWVHPTLSLRDTEGYFEKNFEQIIENDELLFKSTRMAKHQFELLVDMIGKHLTCAVWSRKGGIIPKCRIFLTLMYLSEGASIRFLSNTFCMGQPTVRKIIMEVCATLWKVLQPLYMPEFNKNDWKEISQKYLNEYCMPHCIGSIDGKHIRIKPSKKLGERRRNKSFESIIMLGICDTNYNFSAVDVLTEGCHDEGSIFRNSSLGKKIFEGDPNLPPPEKLPSSEVLMSYYFVAPSVFPLRKNLMRPYAGYSLTEPEKNFNSKLSNVSLTADNAFGVLSVRWKSLTNCINFESYNADKVVYACVVLHNFLKITGNAHNCNIYCPENYCDSFDEHDERVDGNWRQESVSLLSIRRCSSNNSPKNAMEERQILTKYLSQI